MEHVSVFFKEENDPFFQKGFRKGLELVTKKRIGKALDLNQEFVRNLVTQFDLSDEQIADAVNVSVEFVKEIRAKIAKE